MKTKTVLFYLLAGILCGCVPVMSIHPLHDKDNLIFEEKILGAWIDDSNETIWEFQPVVAEPNNDWGYDLPDEPEKAYKLILSNFEGNTGGTFFAHLVKLDDDLFMDIVPSQLPCSAEDPNKFFALNGIFLMPVHTFLRVDTIEPQLKMRMTDDDQMQKLFKKDPNAVQYVDTDDLMVLTAPTEELQDFVIKYCDDPKLFSNELLLNRKEPAKAIDPNENK